MIYGVAKYAYGVRRLIPDIKKHLSNINPISSLQPRQNFGHRN